MYILSIAFLRIVEMQLYHRYTLTIVIIFPNAIFLGRPNFVKGKCCMSVLVSYVPI